MLYSAFLLGFLGSFHCVGMCGPIALSLPLSQRSNTARWLGHFTYQAGKILAYICLGIVMGIFGKGMSFFGFQNWYAILLGAMMLWIGASTFSKKFNILIYLEQKMSFFKGNIARFFSSSGYMSLLSIGFLNGLLPCGLVYMAILAAAAMPAIEDAALYMLLFGLGVMPSLIMLSIFGHWASAQWRLRFQKAYPIVAISLGLFLIVRGVYFLQMENGTLGGHSQQEVPMCVGHY
jgi:uncharacterized protein